MKRIQVFDLSASEELESIIRRLIAGRKTVLLCGISEPRKRFLDAVGLTRMVGEDNIFMAEDTVYASSNKAYGRALAIGRAG